MASLPPKRAGGVPPPRRRPPPGGGLGSAAARPPPRGPGGAPPPRRGLLRGRMPPPSFRQARPLKPGVDAKPGGAKPTDAKSSDGGAPPPRRGLLRGRMPPPSFRQPKPRKPNGDAKPDGSKPSNPNTLMPPRGGLRVNPKAGSRAVPRDTSDEPPNVPSPAPSPSGAPDANGGGAATESGRPPAGAEAKANGANEEPGDAPAPPAKKVLPPVGASLRRPPPMRRAPPMGAAAGGARKLPPSARGKLPPVAPNKATGEASQPLGAEAGTAAPQAKPAEPRDSSEAAPQTSTPAGKQEKSQSEKPAEGADASAAAKRVPLPGKRPPPGLALRRGPPLAARLGGGRGRRPLGGRLPMGRGRGRGGRIPMGRGGRLPLGRGGRIPMGRGGRLPMGRGGRLPLPGRGVPVTGRRPIGAPRPGRVPPARANAAPSVTPKPPAQAQSDKAVESKKAANTTQSLAPTGAAKNPPAAARARVPGAPAAAANGGSSASPDTSEQQTPPPKGPKSRVSSTAALPQRTPGKISPPPAEPRRPSLGAQPPAQRPRALFRAPPAARKGGEVKAPVSGIARSALLGALGGAAKGLSTTQQSDVGEFALADEKSRAQALAGVSGGGGGGCKALCCCGGEDDSRPMYTHIDFPVFSGTALSSGRVALGGGGGRSGTGVGSGLRMFDIVKGCSPVPYASFDSKDRIVNSVAEHPCGSEVLVAMGNSVYVFLLAAPGQSEGDASEKFKLVDDWVAVPEREAKAGPGAGPEDDKAVAARVQRIDFNFAGDLVATAGNFGKVRVWQYHSKQMVCLVDAVGPGLLNAADGTGEATSATFTQDSKGLVTCNNLEQHATLWAVQTGQRLRQIELPAGLKNPAQPVRFRSLRLACVLQLSGDGDVNETSVAIAVVTPPNERKFRSSPSYLVRYDAKTWDPVSAVPIANGRVTQDRLSADGRLVAVSTASGDTKIFETQSLACVKTVSKTHRGHGSCLIFTRDGRGLVSASAVDKAWLALINVPPVGAKGKSQQPGCLQAIVKLFLQVILVVCIAMAVTWDSP